MIEIKTITEKAPHHFDRAVNEALTEGWELVRRECFITGSDRATTFYAELERIIEKAPETDDDEEEDTESAEWWVTRDPTRPYRCSKCGHKTTIKWPKCPSCYKPMRSVEE